VVSALVVLDERIGAVRGQLYEAEPDQQILGVAMTPDKQTALFGVAPPLPNPPRASGCGARLLAIRFDGGPPREIAQGIDPTISLDGSTMAYAKLRLDAQKSMLAAIGSARRAAIESADETIDFGPVKAIAWPANFHHPS
jgi:hypothetical protein